MFQPLYWCGAVISESTEENSLLISDTDPPNYGSNNDYFEADPVGLKAGIKMSNLRKVFIRIMRLSFTNSPPIVRHMFSVTHTVVIKA